MSAVEADLAQADLGGISPAALTLLFSPFAPHERLLLAVSGGPDSTALLLLAARWRRLRDTPADLFVATVDHGLRPQARAEARAVGRLARALGLDHAVLELPAPLPATRLQEAARHARYDLLLDHARAIGASAIATAHTRDDQAETVLFRLMRGSGLSGLGGIPTERAMGGVRLIRPLLGIDKADLVALCRQAGVAFADDPSNQDARFARARLRALLPLLAREGLNAERFARLAGRMARAEAALEAATGEAAARLVREGDPLEMARAGFHDLPDEIGLRLLGWMIERAGQGKVELAKLEALHLWLKALGSAPRGARTLAGALVRVSLRSIQVGQAPARRTG
ncbi:tRNA lysidine(34) synthetase TilS [Ancylobacter amanitiformis]|uniref:tRNA(Ile)-lysidine synthase n=1 Tax=Ancylobacter amanitiformis TaxID=217069 RepID=A0ABU0LNQ2_9HYPH|nr:tRNA lysidine(34) synthetase TilS [Ancylobacter amanitiformis]MDQ0510334.1 tRNA(Ile)-lysidine synthase [Ancylobacter amanitiformis]